VRGVIENDHGRGEEPQRLDGLQTLVHGGMILEAAPKLNR
jgi:hypothetical protein